MLSYQRRQQVGQMALPQSGRNPRDNLNRALALCTTNRSAAWNTTRCSGTLHTLFSVPTSTLQFDMVNMSKSVMRTKIWSVLHAALHDDTTVYFNVHFNISYGYFIIIPQLLFDTARMLNRALALRRALCSTRRSATWNTSRCGGLLHTSFVVPASTIQFDMLNIAKTVVHTTKIWSVLHTALLDDTTVYFTVYFDVS